MVNQDRSRPDIPVATANIQQVQHALATSVAVIPCDCEAFFQADSSQLQLSPLRSYVVPFPRLRQAEVIATTGAQASALMGAPDNFIWNQTTDQLVSQP